MKNIVLIGMRGSGKSTIGKILAKNMGRNLWDSDREVEKKTGKKIAEIFQEKGEKGFRELEKKEIARIAQERNAILATGGGVILDNENVENLKKNGVFVFLQTPIQILVERISRNKNRPSLTGKDITEELGEIWKKRKERYHFCADIIINANKSHGIVAEEIMAKFDKFSEKK